MVVAATTTTTMLVTTSFKLGTSEPFLSTHARYIAQRRAHNDTRPSRSRVGRFNFCIASIVAGGRFHSRAPRPIHAKGIIEFPVVPSALPKASKAPATAVAPFSLNLRGIHVVLARRVPTVANETASTAVRGIGQL